MILQLNPYLPVIVTSKNNREGHACLVTDVGQDEYKTWTVIMDDTGEIWDVPNPEVKVRWNWTLGRRQEPVKKLFPEDDFEEWCRQADEHVNWTYANFGKVSGDNVKAIYEAGKRLRRECNQQKGKFFIFNPLIHCNHCHRDFLPGDIRYTLKKDRIGSRCLHCVDWDRKQKGQP